MRRNPTRGVVSLLLIATVCAVAPAQQRYDLPRPLPRMAVPSSGPKAAPGLRFVPAVPKVPVSPLMQPRLPASPRTPPIRIMKPPRSLSELDGTVRAAITGKPVTPTKEEPLLRPETITTFDPRLVKLQYADRRWTLTGGGLSKNFGKREEEARRALHAIQTLGLNQRGTIGKPTTVMEYWLADGRAPAGMTPGLRRLPLKLDELRAAKVYHEWFLRDRRRSLFRFGSDEQGARQALAVLRKYRFEEVAIVGQAVPSMLIFLRRNELNTESPQLTRADKLDRPSLDQQAVQREIKSRLPAPKQKKSSLTIKQLPTSIVPPLREIVRKNRRDSIMQAWSPSISQKYAAENNTNAENPNVRRTAFDWRQVQMQLEKGGWKLKVGGNVLCEFGINQGEARLAYAALLHYRFTEMMQVGEKVPDGKYFLVRGQAPRGLMAGVFSEAISPKQMTIRERKGKYFLSQRGRDLVECGTRREDADALLQELRRHQFDRKCRVTSLGESPFTFFVRSR